MLHFIVRISQRLQVLYQLLVLITMLVQQPLKLLLLQVSVLLDRLLDLMDLRFEQVEEPLVVDVSLRPHVHNELFQLHASVFRNGFRIWHHVVVAVKHNFLLLLNFTVDLVSNHRLKLLLDLLYLLP